MKILHIVQLYHPVKTGAGRYFEEIGAGLVAEGHSVTVLSTDAHDLEHLWMVGRRRIDVPEEQHRGMHIVRLPIQRLPGPTLLYPVLRRLMTEASRLPGTSALLRRLALLTPRLPQMTDWLTRNGPFDCIHVGNITLDFAILPAQQAAHATGARFLCTPFIHLGKPGSQALLRYYTMRHQLDILRHSDMVLTMTERERSYLEQHAVPSSRLRVVGVGVNPIELAGGNAQRFRATHQIQGPVILYIGALARDKGAIDTIEALQKLHRSGKNVTLVLIGAPLTHFNQYYTALPGDLKAYIRLLPYADDATKRDALATCDMLCMPSRTDSFGITYLEAWCYQRPVIGANAGGVPDVISDQHDGLLVPFGDPQALADAIQFLLENPEKAQAMGQAGYAKVIDSFTWERVYARVRPAYVKHPRAATDQTSST